MDIRSGAGYPAGALSNFRRYNFVFDGVECASMEGLLQAFKFDKPHIQVAVCQLWGKKAKFRGKKRDRAWKQVQMLWWKGKAMNRHGLEYQIKLDLAFESLAQNPDFIKALLATGNATLTHSLGKSNPHDTVLTEREFCSRLEKIRSRLQKKGGKK